MTPAMTGTPSAQHKSRTSQHYSKNANESEGTKPQQIFASKTIEHTNVTLPYLLHNLYKSCKYKFS